MKKIVLALAFFLVFTGCKPLLDNEPSHADVDGILEIVSTTEWMIATGRYGSARDANISENEYFESSESSPPSLVFYMWDNGNLMAADIRKGHETWAKEFLYFFDEDGVPIYYRDRTFYRPDNPGDLEVFYADGNPVEMDTDPILDVKEIIELFESGDQPSERQFEAMSSH